MPLVLNLRTAYWQRFPCCALVLSVKRNGAFQSAIQCFPEREIINRCTPWCNTHDPHAEISKGKRGYTIALRTGPGMKECERVIGSIEHFYGHLEIECMGNLGLCSVENKADAVLRESEIEAFCRTI